MSRPARKPTLWTLYKVSTRISLSMLRRLTRTDTFRLLWIFCFRNHYSVPLRWNVMARISLHRLHRQIWVDTLRRVYNVFFRGMADIYWKYPYRNMIIERVVNIMSNFFLCYCTQKLLARSWVTFWMTEISKIYP